MHVSMGVISKFICDIILPRGSISAYELPESHPVSMAKHRTDTPIWGQCLWLRHGIMAGTPDELWTLILCGNVFSDCNDIDIANRIYF